MNNIDEETMIEAIQRALGLDHYDFRNRGKFGYNYKYYVWDPDEVRDRKMLDELREKAKGFPQIIKVELGAPYIHSDTSRRYMFEGIKEKPAPDVRALRICCKAKMRPKQKKPFDWEKANEAE